jgi:hypothetical protein
VKFAIEALVNGQWAREHAGAVDDTTLFDSRSEAESAIAELTENLGWDAGELRAVPVIDEVKFSWKRTDQSDGASEVLRLVVTEDRRTFVCAGLEGREFPYLVQITTGPEVGDDFVGLYDLDGEEVRLPSVKWELASDVPGEVIEQIESGWESGSKVVDRIAELES